MAPRLTAVEFIVTDLDRALELLAQQVGFPVTDRFRHARFDAEVVVLGAEPVSIILVSPTETGQGTPVPIPDDRLSQLIFEPAGDEEFLQLRERLVMGGAAVANDGAAMFHLSTTLMEAVFGVAPPLVFTTAPDPEWTGAPQPLLDQDDPTDSAVPPDAGSG